MDPRSEYATWAEIDLDAVEGNVRELRRLASAELMAVVKADAYGHGAVEVARAVLRAGASRLAVARPVEALQLRRAGIDAPILTLSPAAQGRLAELITQDVSLTVSGAAEIERVQQAAGAAGRAGRVHLKLDTGMSRLGAAPQDAVSLAEQIATADELQFEGVFTHFARADEGNRAPVLPPLDLFRQTVEALAERDLRPPLVHAANSAAMLTFPETHFDLVRCGIALYGLHPSAQCRLPEAFRPAMQWKAQLLRVRSLPPGSGVSYGHEYVTESDERIGTLPVGYADGLRRLPGNQVLVGGSVVPVVGRVCMDLCMLRLEGVPQAEPGDEVVLIGRQGSKHIAAEEVAHTWGTINYEVTCAVGARVPRIYRTAAKPTLEREWSGD